ncbi:hypothetical protein [Streptomyces sp. NPDC047315]
MTSPTKRATRLPGSGIASYQSPPTRPSFVLLTLSRRDVVFGAV